MRDALGSGVYTLHHCLNHSCEPNAFVTFTERDSTLSLFALRPIPAGEEICFDYIGFPDPEVDGEEPAASAAVATDEAAAEGHGEFCMRKKKSTYGSALDERQAAMRTKFYFDCKCTRCSREMASQRIA